MIDDDPDVLSVAASFLERWGYEVLRADDVRAGLDLLEAEPADLVLTDFFTPRGTGIDVVEWAAGRQPVVPVIIMSGSWLPEERKRAETLGVPTFHKPFDWGKMKAAMTRLLDPGEK